jgi:uncharacterized protein YybS (DUF2232 family)
LNKAIKSKQVWSIIAIILALVASNISMLSLLSVLVVVPYAMIGMLSDKKYYLISLIFTFVILVIAVSPVYAINICVLSAIPGLVIGNVVKNNLKEENSNKFEPIYAGTLIFVVCAVAFCSILKFAFNIDILNEFVLMIESSFQNQIEFMKSLNIDATDSLILEEILSGVVNMIPTFLFLEGMLFAFLTYIFLSLILKRMKSENVNLPKIREFYLPGNAVMISFVLYLLVLFVKFIGLNFIYTDLIMVNLQLVFNFLFIMQGLAICIYYLAKMMKKGPSKMMLVGAIMIFLSGFTGISFVGMLDSIIDFRKVRTSKTI